MGFLFRGFWNVVFFGALLVVIGGAALAHAVMDTGGQAFGGGLRASGTFLSATGQGFREVDSYEDALAEAEANQAAKDQAAKDKRAAAKRAAAKRTAGGS